MNPIRLTPAVKAIAIACLAVFVLNIIFTWTHVDLVSWLALSWPAVASGKIWTIITYGFVHLEVMHLVLNLLMLVFIGVELESLWGTKAFYQFCLVCLVGVAALYLLLGVVTGLSAQPLLSLSSVIYGLLCAYGILFSERTLLFMMIFPMKAKHFIWVLAGVELLTLLQGGQSALASVIQVGGGMGIAFLYLIWKAKNKRGGRGGSGGVWGSKPKKKASQHLKLVVDNPNQRDPKNWQ